MWEKASPQNHEVYSTSYVKHHLNTENVRYLMNKIWLIGISVQIIMIYLINGNSWKTRRVSYEIPFISIKYKN